MARRQVSRRRFPLALVLVLLGSFGVAAPCDASQSIVKLEINGVIGPAVADYVVRGLEQAWEDQAAMVIIEMDTPGGLDRSMRDIIRQIVSAPIPVVTYVAPGGARAASAGTYILYASHIAAMAPGTNLGAATPVPLGGWPRETQPGASGKDRAGSGHDSAMANKIVNDAVAYIRGLAQMRGRNVEWAERAVREGASLSADEALALGVIDLSAGDLPELLTKLHGYQTRVLGQMQTLDTSAPVLERREPDWRSRFLAIVTDPNIAYVLMLIGIYGLIYEFASPGMILPGVVGTICLLIALFAFQLLPISYAGLALMLFGIAFMIAELFVASFGVLGIGGAAAFVIGSIMLLDTGIPGYGVSVGMIALFAILSAAFTLTVLGLAVKARKRPVVSGVEEMVGATGVAIDSFSESGEVRVHGERWWASTQTPVRKGEQVRVLSVDGLHLSVAPVDFSDRGG